MKTTIHIRAAEGGGDARLLAADLATSYVALCNRLGHRTERRRIGTGWDVVVEGYQKKLLGRESGGHRFQRIPPTEKRGRVQTSSVTVSVTTDERRPGPWDLRDEKHFVVEWRSGTGPGGQHKNKTQSNCRMTHLPTGISEYHAGRNRVDNQREASKALLARLDQMKLADYETSSSLDRRSQTGSGMRGDKIRTIRFQDDTAVDHSTGKRMKASRYMKGFMDELWIDDQDL